MLTAAEQNDRSAQPCGCDIRASWICEQHRKAMAADAPYIEAHAAKIKGIHDSGLRQKYSSGAMRDPAIGKIDWTRITYGPMMRRWAQHLTTAEAKYPDAALGVPNFMLIETQEELWRYKKSAFRHFMSWFFNETDEDHASATFFNINGVEIIKLKLLQKEKAEIDAVMEQMKERMVPLETFTEVVAERSRCRATFEDAGADRDWHCSLHAYHKGRHEAYRNHDPKDTFMASWENTL